MKPILIIYKKNIIFGYFLFMLSNNTVYIVWASFNILSTLNKLFKLIWCFYALKTQRGKSKFIIHFRFPPPPPVNPKVCEPVCNA